MLDLGHVKRPKLSTEILSRLQRGIRDGELRPGDQLPPERELAESLGVSRNSVREALRALEVLGVVEVRHGEGTFVRIPDISTLLGPVFDVLVTKQDFVLEVLEFRRMIEPAICRLAATNATEADLQHLREILAQQEERVLREKPVVDVDMEFHRSIAMATHNSIIGNTLELISTLFQQFRDVWGEGRPARSTDSHRKVLDAIARRDGEGAARAMDLHLGQVQELVSKEIESLAKEVLEGTRR